MTNGNPSLRVAVQNDSAIVKVAGRANFTTSVSFKRLVTELQERGFDCFTLDLSDCVTMDSTFLGVLAGTALRLIGPPQDKHSNGQTPSSPNHPSGVLNLLNPNQRVSDLIDNLGISDLFQFVQEPAPSPAPDKLTPAETPEPSREELSRTCLEAHRILMDLNPANAARFKDVAQFLAEDIHKLRTKNAPETNNPGELERTSRK